ncbi:hypothetical protein DNU06_16145 [Putridiphycobacter roseus]|uniref:Beta-carotene 15,15'-monooxygenase n=1 Tax=Putridiphycobacter roseus TaxID=2219161 RepID=A0A2W1NJK7_9FLAO|nr:DUF6427 family protein [Putridiphycobacter roseus]PZE15802.1 hypothetical protein DNU06_16145 [Putridiphycobacter roseus]
MIKLFKSNIPLTVVISVLLVLVFSSQVFFNPEIFKYYFFDWYAPFLNWIYAHQNIEFIFSVLFVVITGILLNTAFNKTSFYIKSTALPIFIYVTVMSTFGGFYFQTSLVVDLVFALTFLKLIELDQNKTAIHIGFTAGLILGIGFLFSYWILPVGFLVFYSLVTFRPFVFREWLVTLLGMSLPFVYLLSIQYLFIEKTTVQPLLLSQKVVAWNVYDISAFILLLIIALLGIIGLFKHFKFVSIIESKQINVLLFFTVLTGLLSLGIYLIHGVNYFLFTVPLVFILSIYLLNTKRERLMSILFFLLLVLNMLRIFVF